MKLQIEKMIYGGAGLAYAVENHTASALRVPFTIPGELVEAEVLDSSTDFEQASLLKVLKSSNDRVQPRCEHFGECGGCQYQHIEYESQAKIKTSILQDVLSQSGINSQPDVQSHTGEPWAYRNRIRLRLEQVDGVLQAGYNRRGSNQFLPIRECPISASLLWRATESLVQIATETSTAGQWIRGAAEVEFFISADDRALQMTLLRRKNQPGFVGFCESLKARVPELSGAGSSLLGPANPQRQIQKPRPLEAWGASGLSYRIKSEEYWVSRGSFFQVNRSLVEELVSLVTTGRQGELAWDLYAGVGLFSRVLAKSFRQVVAVEAAGHDLINTFRGPGRRAAEATTVEFLRHAVIQRERPQLIVMDPPRAGVGAEVCSLLTRISAPEIVYVSCDPVTLARDLARLIEGGYTLLELHTVDLFPQTFHLETVAFLRR
jgi:23S rRNA (uracil1939-C5)-methyltransferase